MEKMQLRETEGSDENRQNICQDKFLADNYNISWSIEQLCEYYKNYQIELELKQKRKSSRKRAPIFNIM